MPDPILNDTGFVPQGPDQIADVNLPDSGSIKSPFQPYGDTTHQPEYKPVGGDTASLSSMAYQLMGNKFADPYFKAQKFETPEIQGEGAAEKSNYYEKIGGVQPGMDVEETYAKAQSNWDKLGKAVAGVGILAAHQFKDQLVSWGDTVDIFTSSPVFKQAEMDQINEWQKNFNNEYHIFQTQDDRNSFFNMSNFANTLQQSGYAIGAALEMAAEEGALSLLTAATFGGSSEIQAARSFQLLGRLGKVAERTRDLEKTIQSTETLRSIFNNGITKFINPLESTTDFALDFNKIRRADQLAYGSAAGLRTTARGFGAAYRDLRMINSGISEAKAEAAGTMQDTYNGMVQKYIQDHGTGPDAETNQKFKDESYKTAQTDGAIQAVWIAMSERVAFDSILKNFKSARFLDDGLAAQGIFTNSAKAIAAGEDQFVAKTGWKGFMHQLKNSPVEAILKTPLNYTKANLMEGTQETGQDIINQSVKDYYTYKYGDPQAQKNRLSTFDIISKAAKDQFTMNGAKTFMSGFLTGGILNILGRGIRSGQDLGLSVVKKEGYKDSKNRIDQQRQDIVTDLNKMVNDKSTLYTGLVNADAKMQESAKAGDEKSYWDYHDDAFRNYALNLIKSGMHDVVLDRMEENVKDLTPKEFAEAFQGAFPPGLTEDQSKTQMTKYLEDFREHINEAKETYHSLQEDWGNPYNPARFEKDSKEYQDEVVKWYTHQEAVEHITLSKQLYKDIGKRQVSVLSDLSKAYPSLDLGTLNVLTNPSSAQTQKEIDLLKEEISTTQDPAIKAEKQKRLDQINEYSEHLHDYAYDISGAENLAERRKVKNAFIAKSHKTIQKLLMGDKPGVIPSDVFHNSIHSIFDYIELQHNHDEALNNFNLLANPFTYDSFMSSHYKEMLNQQKKTDILNKQIDQENEVEERDTENPEESTTGSDSLYKDIFSAATGETNHLGKKESLILSLVQPLIEEGAIKTPEELQVHMDSDEFKKDYADAKKEAQQTTKEKEEVAFPNLEEYLKEQYEESKQELEEVGMASMMPSFEKWRDGAGGKSATYNYKKEQEAHAQAQEEESSASEETQQDIPKEETVEKHDPEEDNTPEKSYQELALQVSHDTIAEADKLSSTPKNKEKNKFRISVLNKFLELINPISLKESQKDFEEWAQNKPKEAVALRAHDKMVKAVEAEFKKLSTAETVVPTEEVTNEPVEESRELDNEDAKPVQEKKDIDQNFTEKDLTSNTSEEELRYVEDLKQIAPSNSLANTTDLVKVIQISPTDIRLQRGDVNKNYVATVATPEFMPGQNVHFEVITSGNYHPVNRLTGETYSTSDHLENGQVKTESYDKVAIGIFAIVDGKSQQIGTLHEPAWIEENKGGVYPHIVVPDGTPMGDKHPVNVEVEVAKLQAIRKTIIDQFNKNPDEILKGVVTEKSMGILRTTATPAKIASRVSPEIAKGGTDNRHGMFAIIRQGNIQVERGIPASSVVMTKAFSPENISRYEGVPVLMLPTPDGRFFPTFIKLPTLNSNDVNLILEAWKAFTGQTSDSSLVEAIYSSRDIVMDTKGPNIDVLKGYIRHYLTQVEDSRISKVGNGIDTRDNVARINITKDGDLYLQAKKGGVFSNIKVKKGDEIPSELPELMELLRTTISFPDPNDTSSIGINSINKGKIVSISENRKVSTSEMTYNQYIMGRAETFIDKGIKSKNENKDWVYFANPVVKMDVLGSTDSDISDTIAESPKADIEQVNTDIDDEMSKFLAAANAQDMTDQEIEDQIKNCLKDFE